MAARVYRSAIDNGAGASAAGTLCGPLRVAALCRAVAWSAALCTLLACVSCSKREEPIVRAEDPAARRAALEGIETSLRAARLDDALRIALRLADALPNDADVQEILGRTHLARSVAAVQPALQSAERAAAAQAYLRAALLQPTHAGLQSAAGVAAQQAGMLTEAITCFERAQSADAANAQHPLYLGQVLLQSGDLPRARACLERARDLAPESPWPLSGLAGLELQAGNAPLALVLAQRARALDPQADQLRIIEAKALRKLARHAEVLTLLLALPPKSRAGEAFAWEIASAHESLGDRVAAAAAWGEWAEQCAAADAAVDAARRWEEAGDPIQAASWRRVAMQRGWVPPPLPSAANAPRRGE